MIPGTLYPCPFLMINGNNNPGSLLLSEITNNNLDLFRTFSKVN